MGVVDKVEVELRVAVGVLVLDEVAVVLGV